MGSAKSGTYKPAQTKKIQLEEITNLASEGKSRRSISNLLSLSNNVFARDQKCEDAYLDGLAILRDKVASATIASKDYRDRALLFNRLSVLAEPIEMPEIKSIEDLQKAMTNVLVSFAQGKVTETQLNSFTKASAQLSQLYFDQSIQSQLDLLKEELSHKEDRQEEYS